MLTKRTRDIIIKIVLFGETGVSPVRARRREACVNYHEPDLKNGTVKRGAREEICRLYNRVWCGNIVSETPFHGFESHDLGKSHWNISEKAGSWNAKSKYPNKMNPLCVAAFVSANTYMEPRGPVFGGNTNLKGDKGHANET